MSYLPSIERIFIAQDSQKIIVSSTKCWISGRTDKVVWDRVNIQSALPAILPKAGEEVDGASFLAGALLITVLAGTCTGYLTQMAAGIVVSVIFAAAFIAAGVLLSGQSKKAGAVYDPPPGSPGEHQILQVERESFCEVIDVAERIRATWPRLENLVDTERAAVMLMRALWDISVLLARREALSGLIAQFAVPYGISADNSALKDLNEIRARALDELSTTDTELERHRTNLIDAAEAGERFAREHDFGNTVAKAKHALGQLGSTDNGRASDAGEQLADHTVAVISAYRELSDRYLS